MSVKKVMVVGQYIMFLLYNAGMVCCKCQNEYTIKNGTRHGKQCYLCKGCGFQFTGDYAFIEQEKRVVLTLACFGLSMRKIGMMLGYSHVTICNWIRAFEKSRVTPNEDYFMDLDEMCEFLKMRQSNPRLGRRFSTIQQALTWNVENEMSKIIEKVFTSLA
ncbi:MAG: hypothetical protein FWE01_00715 [Firmicutes bacterium]|nr:hypothetical protein [Bacillota bacterium]